MEGVGTLTVAACINFLNKAVHKGGTEISRPIAQKGVEHFATTHSDVGVGVVAEGIKSDVHLPVGGGDHLHVPHLPVDDVVRKIEFLDHAEGNGASTGFGVVKLAFEQPGLNPSLSQDFGTTGSTRTTTDDGNSQHLSPTPLDRFRDAITVGLPDVEQDWHPPLRSSQHCNNALARAVAPRRTSRDDIPVARRARSPQRPRKRGSGLLKATLLILGGVASALVFGPTLLARFSSLPAEVDGLTARPSLDGRLLGHFPYAEASEDSLVRVGPGLLLHADAADALRAMQRDASYDGVDLRLLSGYRSHSLQEEIFFEVKSERNQTAEERAKVSAPPGYSEHSTGLALDLGDGDEPSTNLSESFELTRAFRWLQNYAAAYHFVLSFPADNPQGVSYEPWHWRFEGTADSLREFEPARRLARTR